jgi:hypothetical protein
MSFLSRKKTTAHTPQHAPFHEEVTLASARPFIDDDSSQADRFIPFHEKSVRECYSKSQATNDPGQQNNTNREQQTDPDGVEPHPLLSEATQFDGAPEDSVDNNHISIDLAQLNEDDLNDASPELKLKLENQKRHQQTMQAAARMSHNPSPGA